MKSSNIEKNWIKNYRKKHRYSKDNTVLYSLIRSISKISERCGKTLFIQFDPKMSAIQVFKSLELIFFEREIFICGTAFVICGIN